MDGNLTNRIRVLKLLNNEDIICNLMLCSDDLRGSVLRKGKLIDKITKQECIAVAFPVKMINHFDINTGNIHTHYLKWMPQSGSPIQLIPISLIASINSAGEGPIKDYKKFFKPVELASQAAPPTPPAATEARPSFEIGLDEEDEKDPTKYH